MLDILFKKPTILDSKEHQDLKITEQANYKFAKDISFCPLGLNEFHEASKSLAIAFYGNEKELIPVALLGDKQNILLNTKNNWKNGFYTPNIIKCYPFGITKLEEAQKSFLVFDKEASNISLEKDAQGAVLFEDDKLNQKGSLALEITANSYKELEKASTLTNELLKLNLFSYANIKASTKDQELDFGSYYIIDQNKLNRLDAKTIKKLVKNGYLNFIYTHLNSLSNKYVL